MEMILLWLAETEFLGLSIYVWGAVLLIAVVLASLIGTAMYRREQKQKRKPDAERTLTPAPAEGGLTIANVHGIGARSYQQDAFAISPLSDASLCEHSGVLLLLADGMGGMSEGGKASAIAVETLMQGFLGGALPSDPAVALASLIYEASRKIEAVHNSGSTVIAALVRGGKLHFAACGDSRLALYRGGALLTLNREQNYAVLLDDRAARGELPYEEAASDTQRHALTSYAGSTSVKVDRSLSPIALCPGDVIVLMSDGIFNALSENELCACLARDVYGAAEAIEQAIGSKALEEQDNFTAILAKFNG